jgi:putative membrane protein
MGYEWLKAFHIAAAIAWMAGLFYLPRLFVYHADSAVGSEQSETFKVMERRLYRIIMNPAMMATWLAGVGLVWWGDWWQAPWLWVKVALVVAMTGLHVWLGRQLGSFAADANCHRAKTYRMVNELPTVLMLAVVVLVVVKPF